MPRAATYPIAVTVAPVRRVPDLPVSRAPAATGLAALLVDVFRRLDVLFDQPMPYMMWINQRPTDGGDWPQAWLNIEIVSPWRSAGVPRFIAAAEVGAEEYFDPAHPPPSAPAGAVTGAGPARRSHR